MARKKVTLAFIANDATRRTTMRKRRKSLIKKVSELATLCDVNASIIIYGQNEIVPEIWPSEDQARQMLSKFRGLPQHEQMKNQMNQMAVLHRRAANMKEQLQKTEQSIPEIQMEVLAYEVMIGRELYDLGQDTLMGLRSFLDEKLKSLHDMVEVAMRAEAGETQTAAVMSQQLSRGLITAPEMQAGPSERQAVSGNNGGLGNAMQPFGVSGKRWMDPSIFTLDLNDH